MRFANLLHNNEKSEYIHIVPQPMETGSGANRYAIYILCSLLTLFVSPIYKIITNDNKCDVLVTAEEVVVVDNS